MDLIHVLAVFVHFIAASLTCNITDVNKCFVNLSEDLGLGSDKIQGSELLEIINPSTVHDDQTKKCSTMANYDFHALRQCVISADCAHEIIPEEKSSALPILTWWNLVDMMQGICQPGCENLQSKNSKAEQCVPKSGTCRDVEESFRCYRDAIGTCDVLVTFTKSILENNGVLEMVQKHCPDVDSSIVAPHTTAATSYLSPAIVLHLMSLLTLLLIQ